MTPAALAEILAAHAKWASGDPTGIRANLRGADLVGANLRGANLVGANLRGADLVGANLRGANLVGADLRGANLVGANLRGANLRDAYLVDANLRGANLVDANLRDAYLVDADLRGANLRGADLVDADLRGADLASIRDDLCVVLDTAAHEVPGLLTALRAGRVDGSTYTGECACLVGTIANVRGCAYTKLGTLTPDSSRPAERWFLAISKGSTPENNPVAKITEGWIVEWMAEHVAAEVTP